MDRMINALNNNRDKSLEDCLNNVRVDVARFANTAEQFDDITLFAFRFLKHSV